MQAEIDKALRSKVWLKSGGSIVINQTEALVAIDVNTGRYVGKKTAGRLEDTIVKTNLEAVKEIVRQIRLRDLGGIIVLDFIDMEEKKNRQKVLQAVEQELRKDRAPSKALQVSDFGLVIITRKRVKQSLERVLTEPCPYCAGSAVIKSSSTICYEILTEVKKIGADLNGQSLVLRVNPDIARALKRRGARRAEGPAAVDGQGTGAAARHAAASRAVRCDGKIPPREEEQRANKNSRGENGWCGVCTKKKNLLYRLGMAGGVGRGRGRCGRVTGEHALFHLVRVLVVEDNVSDVYEVEGAAPSGS